MEIRRLVIVRDTVNSEGGLPAVEPVTRVAACAVIRNPLAAAAREDLSEIVPLGEELGSLLVREALGQLAKPPVAYGKAAIVGLDGDLEHAAAIIHPRMGRPMREAIGGGKAVIPSNVKVAAAGTSICSRLRSSFASDLSSVTSATTEATSAPNSRSSSSRSVSVSSSVSCSQPAATRMARASCVP